MAVMNAGKVIGLIRYEWEETKKKSKKR